MGHRTLRGYAAGIAAGALVVLTPAAAVAGTGGPTDPIGGLVDQAQQQLGGLPGAPSLPGPSLPGPTALPQPGLPPSSLPSAPSSPSSSPSRTPSDDSDISPNETTNPSGPDHAGSQGLHAAAGGQDVADAGHDRTAVRRGGRTRSHATLLALGIFLLAYGAYSLREGIPTRMVSARWAPVAGFAGGTMGTLFGVGAPPYAIYLTRRLTDMAALRATLWTTPASGAKTGAPASQNRSMPRCTVRFSSAQLFGWLNNSVT